MAHTALKAARDGLLKLRKLLFTEDDDVGSPDHLQAIDGFLPDLLERASSDVPVDTLVEWLNDMASTGLLPPTLCKRFRSEYVNRAIANDVQVRVLQLPFARGPQAYTQNAVAPILSRTYQHPDSMCIP